MASIKKVPPPSFIQTHFISRLLLVYSGLYFILSSIVVSLVCLVYKLFVRDKYQRSRFFWRLSQVWIGLFIKGIGSTIHIKKHPSSLNHEPCIFIANHQSMVDILLTTPFLGKPNLTIGKNTFARIPLFSEIYTMGSILVNRKDKNSRAKSVYELSLALSHRMSVCIYPEGTRNTTQATLLPFQNGAFKLSMMTKTAIVPVVIFNSAALLQQKPYASIHPQTFFIHILEPILPTDFATEQDLKTHCFEVMKNVIEQHT